MPILIATLLIPALLTLALASALRLSEEDMMIVYVALFLLTFLVSVAGAHLFEHGQRFRRQKLLEDMTTTQKLAWFFSQRQVVAALISLVALGAWGAYHFRASTEHAVPSPAHTPHPAASTPATSAATTHASDPGASVATIADSPAANTSTAPASTADALASTVAAKAAQEIAQAQAAVQSWANAWATRDVEAYLGAYSPLFLATEGLTRPQWEAQRRQRITAAQGLSITIMDLSVEPVGRDKVKAVFIQKYQTTKLHDLSRKTLILHRHGDAWKILSEQSTPLKG